MNHMEVIQKQVYVEPSAQVVEVKMERSLLQVSTQDYNYHSLDED